MAYDAKLMPARTFVRSGEGSIASYDWVDIAEGSGKVLFYGCADSISGATAYNLMTSQVYSSEIEVKTASATYDFYTPAFNLPQTIKGTAYINATYLGDNGGTADTTFQLKLYRAAADFSNISSVVAGEVVVGAKTTLLAIPCTQTNIKQGDKIHLIITLKKQAPSNYAYLGTDPQNRDGAGLVPSTDTDITTKLLVYIPFRIDL